MATTRLWCRFVNMSQNRVNKQIFLWTHSRAIQNRCKNWVFCVKAFYEDIQMNHLANISYHFDKKVVCEDMSMVLSELWEQRWHSELNRTEARRGTGRNKLRTYRTMKQAFEPENYVTAILPKSHRRAMALFRCGVAPIRLETGRYEGLEEAQRICPFCPRQDGGVIEDEIHTILKCPVYDDIRQTLFTYLYDNMPVFAGLEDSDKLKQILGGQLGLRLCAKTCSLILERRQYILYA
jgi:hypothetical protein